MAKSERLREERDQARAELYQQRKKYDELLALVQNIQDRIDKGPKTVEGCQAALDQARSECFNMTRDLHLQIRNHYRAVQRILKLAAKHGLTLQQLLSLFEKLVSYEDVLAELEDKEKEG